jgi:hypothetical protein
MIGADEATSYCAMIEIKHRYVGDTLLCLEGAVRISWNPEAGFF